MSFSLLCCMFVLTCVFTTSRGDNTPLFSFLGLGDWGGAALGAQNYQNVYDVSNQLAITAATTSSKFIINTGDNFYYCGIQNTSDYLITTDYVAPYSADALNLRWYSALGNHEYGYNVQAQIDYMTLNKNWFLPSRYYHERIKLADDVFATIVVLDSSPCVSAYRSKQKSGYDPCGTEYPTCSIADTDDDFQGECRFHQNIIAQDCTLQYNWLQNVLDAWVPADDWLIVVGHHPLDELDMRDFATLLQKHGFSLYINGHTHTLNQYTLDNKGAYVTTGAGAMVNTQDQSHSVTKAKLQGLNVTSPQFSAVGGDGAGAHTYQTVFNEAVAGFTLHTFNEAFTVLTTQYVSYKGEVVHSFSSKRNGKLVTQE